MPATKRIAEKKTVCDRKKSGLIGGQLECAVSYRSRTRGVAGTVMSNDAGQRQCLASPSLSLTSRFALEWPRRTMPQRRAMQLKAPNGTDWLQNGAREQLVQTPATAFGCCANSALVI